MLRLQNIKLPPLPQEERKQLLEKKIRKELGRLPEYRIVRRSVDARKKPQIFYIYTIDTLEKGEKWPPAYPETLPEYRKAVGKERASLPDGQSTAAGNIPEALQTAAPAPVPVVVGMGPAGLFAALLLARAGLKPLVIEQGAPVGERIRDVESFWNGGPLKTDSNVQFGEGGAGTFSDGKLNTGIKDPSGRIPFVLRTFAEAGADPSICFDAKPHIGTDVLAEVVTRMREELLERGAEILFRTQMTELVTEEKDGELRLAGLKLRHIPSGEETLLRAREVILAPGHSARETFFMLKDKGAEMRGKSFAVGLRIQHPQEMINEDQYGEAHPSDLPAADYKLTARARDGRGVYSFCMCPGGQVVNASSEAGRLCVNGMSRSARDGKNANAALIVQVGPEDFPPFEPAELAGVCFQRQLEEAAYAVGAGKIPVQTLGDFASGEGCGTLRTVIPDMGGEWQPGRVDKAVPPFVRQAILDAMPSFAKTLPGYDRPDAVLAAVEARTSSPVQLLRDEGFESNIRGLFPCGEGAGYAGGITSAAVDGLKTAEELLRRHFPG